MNAKTARLLIACPDARGIIAAVAGFIAKHHGNILDADQHTDKQHGQFFMRVEIDIDGFDLGKTTFARAWGPIARKFDMWWRMQWGDRRKRMAIFVSRAGHCLSDLLWRWSTGELPVDIRCVISNHTDLRAFVRGFQIPFHHLPISERTKSSQELKAMAILRRQKIDFIVLARYMQVLSTRFVTQHPERIINIHHSFLPAFAGPRPYHQAFERGVKIIGATSHYATEELDQGPIIAQQTMSVGHRDSIEDLVRKGRDLERVVLAAAVRAHVEDRILVSKNKTVVFE